MAVATVLATVNAHPNGNDNTQRRQMLYGLGSFLGSSPSYVKGGLRINFSNLEFIKAVTMLPEWAEFDSISNSGYLYEFAPLGAQITNLALTSNVITITANNNLAAGDVVKLSGLQTTTALNGVSLTVISTGLSATQFEANFTASNISSAAETGYALPTSYASGLPFQGNLQIFQGPGSAAPLAELATGALPTAIVGSTTVNSDVVGFKAEFIRAL